MQTIKHNYKNIHKIFDDIERAYYITSENKAETGLIKPSFDTSFEDLFIQFYDYANIPMPKLLDKEYEPLSLPKYDNNNVILCFSGGKDSIATALKLKEMGLNVYLYCAKNINPSLADESKSAEESAKILGLPIYFEQLKLSGTHCYMEHPMKNMIIANGALHYGISNNLGTRIVFGNYLTSMLVDNVFSRCAGDCMDMWDCYNQIIRRIIPDFRIECYLDNMGETLELITDKKDLMNSSISCLCRHSLRQYRHDWVKDKFGLELPAHRCGSCYKCCVEYIYMADRDRVEYNKEYYKYCLNQLRRVVRQEGDNIYDILDLWDMYCFYPIEQSKFYPEILNSRIAIASVRWYEEKRR